MLFGPAMTVLAQDVVKPGQIGVESAAVIAPGVEPMSSPSVTVTNTVATVEDRHEKKMNRIWVASLFAMAAASGMDAASSWGKLEGNSLLASPDGTFGAKGMSIKVGIAAGVVLPQILLRKHKNLKSKFAIANFAEAGLFGGVAIHNMGIAASK
jgi:hypothetical protein